MTKHSPRNSNWKEPDLKVFLTDFVWLHKITANTQKRLYSVRTQIRNKLVSTLFWLVKPLPWSRTLSEKNCERSIYVLWQTSRMESFLAVNPFHITDLFWYPLKTSENLWFSYVFRGYQRWSVAWNGLIIVEKLSMWDVCAEPDYVFILTLS